MVIMVKDHVDGGCYTNQDGEMIYKAIAPHITAGEQVMLSFKGINSVSSSFLNTAFVPLLESTDFETIKKCLKIVDSNKFINEMIIRRFKAETELVKS